MSQKNDIKGIEWKINEEKGFIFKYINEFIKNDKIIKTTNIENIFNFDLLNGKLIILFIIIII